MNARLKIGYIIILLGLITRLQAQYKTDDERAKFYLEVSKMCSPDSYEILLSDDKKSFVEFANQHEDWKDLLANYGTVVHETCHGYNWKIGLRSGWENDGYFITNNITIAARKGIFFPSAALNKIVPKEHQEKIFRYKTYVGGEPGNSSTLEGIYGFVDEFSAYYHGTKAGLEIRPYFEKQCPYRDARCWTDSYLAKVQSTLYAYYEFRLFIAWYLIYAEQHEKKVYDDFIGNQNLRVAYTLLDDLFKKLVDDYFVIRADVVDQLNSSGNKIELTDEYIYIVHGFSKSGNGIPDDDIQYLKALYTEKENSMLDKFRVNDVDLSNYKKFIEELK